MLHRRGHRHTLPDGATGILERGAAMWNSLAAGERSRLATRSAEFLDRTEFEAAGGAAVDDTTRVIIAAHAARLVLDLGIAAYRDVHSVIVYPSTVVHRGVRGITPGTSVCSSAAMPILGEAMLHGPVVLAWDAVARDASNPEGGHNVVYHEFAHKLDMLTGAADGVPPLRSRSAELEWKTMIDAVVVSLREAEWPDPVLGAYAETNAAECFAVATEAFFSIPQQLMTRHRALHDALAGFYRGEAATS